MLDVPPEVTEAGAKDTVAPVGRPEAVRPTVCGLPERVAVLIVEVAGVPTTAVPEVGEALMEKSPGGGGAVPPLNRAMPAAQYMAVVKEPAKLWAAGRGQVLIAGDHRDLARGRGGHQRQVGVARAR